MNTAEVDQRFFNFTPATLAAIRDFQSTRDPALVEPILHGIIGKYLPETIPTHDGVPPPETLNAFGFESLTLVEMFLDLQDAFGVRFSDAELRGLHGLTDTCTLLRQKVAALYSPMTGSAVNLPSP